MFVTRYQKPSFNHLVNTFFDEFFEGKQLEKSFDPAVNTRETKENYLIEAELPGMKKEDVTLKLDKGVLIISGEKQLVTESEEDHYYSKEIQTGAFSRSFRLPENVELERIDATFTDGILTVALPKSATSKTQTISIK